MAAWSSLKQLAKEASSTESENPDEQEQITVARALLKYRLKKRIDRESSPNCRPPFSQKFPLQHPGSVRAQSSTASTSKILPLICSSKTQPPEKCNLVTSTNRYPLPSQPMASPAFQSVSPLPENRGLHIHKFPAGGAAPCIPIWQLVMPYHHTAPSVSIRTAVPCFSSPCMPLAGSFLSPLIHAGPAPIHFAAPITLGPRVPVFASTAKIEDPIIPENNLLARAVKSKTAASRQP